VSCSSERADVRAYWVGAVVDRAARGAAAQGKPVGGGSLVAAKPAGHRREAEPAAQISARLSKPPLPAWWLSAVVEDVHPDHVIAGTAMRIRRGGTLFLDLIAAESSDLQLVFARFGLPTAWPGPRLGTSSPTSVSAARPGTLE